MPASDLCTAPLALGPRVLVWAALACQLCAGHAHGATHRVPQDHTTITAALAASAPGDTVRVAAGTYASASNGETFPLTLDKPGVVLIGAGTGSTTLDAANSSNVILWSAPGNGRVSGFTITGGRAALGGGVLVLAGSVELDHLRFLHNGASVGGGAIATLGTPAPWIHHNVILDSYSTSGLDVHALRLNGKTAGLFEHNLVAQSDGNGLLTVDSVSTQVRNNIFYRNGIPSPPRGRGICWISDLPAHVHHNLFFQNQVAALFWSMGGGDYDALMANAYSPLDDVYANVEADPAFVAPAARDYRLLAGSPAIDAGDPAAPRDADGSVADIGPFARLAVTAVTPPAGSIALSVAPNPARSHVTVRFSLTTRADVEASVLDVTGREIMPLIAQTLDPGMHAVPWDGRDRGGRVAPPGVYLVRVRQGGQTQLRRFTLVR